jgi:DNA-binding beta-propeller fold protein YncE
MALRREGFIPIPPGATPGYDHADVYLPPGGPSRLYVAHTGADRVDVLDCGTGTHLRAIADLPGVAGVLVDSAQDLLLTTDRAAARVSVFRCSSETLLGRVAVGPHPNGLAYDPARHRAFAFCLGEPLGIDCSVSVVDIDRLATVATVPLPGRPRWAVFDAATDAVYAAIQRPAEIVVLDAAKPRIVREIAVPSDGPHGLWLLGNRLYCAADGGELVAIHRDTGEVLGSAPLPGAPDVVMCDAERGRLYVAVGAPGTITSIDAASLTVLETIETEDGAHTLSWDPVGGLLYAFLPRSEGALVLSDS